MPVSPYLCHCSALSRTRMHSGAHVHSNTHMHTRARATHRRPSARRCWRSRRAAWRSGGRSCRLRSRSSKQPSCRWASSTDGTWYRQYDAVCIPRACVLACARVTKQHSVKPTTQWVCKQCRLGPFVRAFVFVLFGPLCKFLCLCSWLGSLSRLRAWCSSLSCWTAWNAGHVNEGSSVCINYCQAVFKPAWPKAW